MKGTNLISETEMPGSKVNREQLQMICCRYYTASRFVEGKTVLEVGCGPGLGLGYLASKGAERVIGGDCTEASLRCAQKHYEGRAELLLLDAHKMPFKESCFDVVLLFEVVYYLSQPDKFLDECRSILKEGGELLLCLPNKDLPGFRRSPLSIGYFGVPELFALLSRHHFDVELFGAFPVNGVTRHTLQAAITLMVGKALNLMPKGREVKELLNKLILGKTLVLKEEIEDGMMENFQLVPLPCHSPSFRYKVLYAIAHAR